MQVTRFRCRPIPRESIASTPVATPSAREPIEACLAIVLGGAPVGSDRSFLLEPQQDWIQCPLVDRQKISADLLDSPGNPVAMQRSENIQSFQNHERQRALSNVRFLHISIGLPT